MRKQRRVAEEVPSSAPNASSVGKSSAAGVSDGTASSVHEQGRSAPSLLERADSSPSESHRGSVPSPSVAPDAAAGYFTARNSSHSRHYDVMKAAAGVQSSAKRQTFPAPPARDWSFGSAWSWGSDHKAATTVKYTVTGTGHHGTAAPLISMAKAPEHAGRLAVAGRHALKILQISTVHDSSSPKGTHCVVEQVEDVRDASRLGKSYSLNDLKWGYSGTSRKLVTGCSNGCVMLWDLESARRVEQTKFEHDRAVNRVLFAGGSGNWMISAAQDGFCKLWDVRTPSVANLALASFSDAARDIACHPLTSAPHLYTLCTVHESGALLKWDLRRANQPVDRIQAHAGSCLTMSWKGSSSQYDEDEGEGHLATSGLDRTVKIWKMSGTSLPPRPLHTLNPAEPVARLAWRPGFPAELATIPLVTAGSGETATSEGVLESVSNVAARVDIWDVRRPYVPKASVLHQVEGSASCVLFPDASTIWTTHKTSATFVQHDLERDLVNLNAMLPRTAFGWASSGEFAFAVSARSTDFAEDQDAPPADVEAAPFALEQELASVLIEDLDFNVEVFTHLATSYVVNGMPFEQLCLHNASVADEVNRLDAAQTWRILGRWYGQSEVEIEAETIASTVEAGSATGSVQLAGSALESLLRGGSLTPASSSPSRKRPISDVRKLSLVPEQADSGDGTDDESSENDHSVMRESLSSLKPSEELRLAASSSESEDFFAIKALSTLDSLRPGSPDQRRSIAQNGSSSSGPKSRSSSKSSQFAPTPRPGRSSGLLTPNLQSMLSPHLSATQTKMTVSPAGSSSDSGDEGPYGVGKHTAQKLLTQSRRTLSDYAGASGAATKARHSRSRTRRVAGMQLNKTASALEKLPTRGSLAAQATVAKHQEREAKERARETVKPEPDETLKLKETVAERLTVALIDVLGAYADEGDVQMCVTVMLVMQDRIDFDIAFRIRTTASYLDLLRRFDLPVSTTEVMTASQDDRFRLKNTLSTTIHTACGRCRKGLNEPSFGVCHRCRAPAIRCTICHLTIQSALLGICSYCGHGVHRECLASFLQPGPIGSHSAIPSRSSVATTPAASDPSTPKFFFGEWLWGSDDAEGGTPHRNLSQAGSTPSPRLSFQGLRREELFSCPSGCECSPCGVFQCLDQLAVSSSK